MNIAKKKSFKIWEVAIVLSIDIYILPVYVNYWYNTFVKSSFLPADNIRKEPVHRQTARPRTREERKSEMKRIRRFINLYGLLG